MDPILLGFILGAGTVLITTKGRSTVRGVVGWAARSVGSFVQGGRNAIEAAKAATREEWLRGRTEPPNVTAEPASVRAAPPASNVEGPPSSAISPEARSTDDPHAR